MLWQAQGKLPQNNMIPMFRDQNKANSGVRKSYLMANGQIPQTSHATNVATYDTNSWQSLQLKLQKKHVQNDYLQQSNIMRAAPPKAEAESKH
jgi:hypothetical protein